MTLCPVPSHLQRHCPVSAPFQSHTNTGEGGQMDGQKVLWCFFFLAAHRSWHPEHLPPCSLCEKISRQWRLHWKIRYLQVLLAAVWNRLLIQGGAEGATLTDARRARPTGLRHLQHKLGPCPGVGASCSKGIVWILERFKP